MKMIAVGDNVTDCYLDQQIFYPGGNAVNVAVNCRRSGFEEAAYLGVFGTDRNAEHLKWALALEGVSYSRSRTCIGKSGQPGVTLNEEGDRVFVGGPQDTVQHILRLRLTAADLAYIKTFHICHTSCYSSIEPELPAMKGACQVSFDFSDRRDQAYLEIVCPHIRFAFFSGSDLTVEEAGALADRCHALGAEYVGVTRGKYGAVFSHNGKRYHQGIKETTVVDTMGAGDSFIAGFLTAITHGDSVETALDFAANCAARTCTFYGGFGHPHPFVK